MTASPRVLVVSGSAHADGPLAAVVAHVHAVLRQTTPCADVRTHDLARLHLPLMDQGNPDQSGDPAVLRVRRDVAWAQGFVLVTPEYHGNMSGALKNWFDFLWHELAGKFAGVIAVTGGGGGDMSLTAVRNCFNWCHGFTLPYAAAARPADFDDAGALRPAGARDRVSRIVYDVCRYAPTLDRSFGAARDLGPGLAAGVAGLHVED